MINKVILIGNLGRDPEVRRLDNGAAVAKFSMATNENYRDKSGEWQTNTEWHNIVMWRALAERAETSLKKGSMIYLEGKLTHRKYQDKDGIEKYTTEVVANTFRMLDRRESGSSSGPGFPTAENAPPTYQPTTAPVATGGGTVTSSDVATPEDDDLPF